LRYLSKDLAIFLPGVTRHHALRSPDFPPCGYHQDNYTAAVWFIDHLLTLIINIDDFFFFLVVLFKFLLIYFVRIVQSAGIFGIKEQFLV